MDEQELLESFHRKGDLKDLGKLYEGYMPLIYGSCLKYLKNETDAEDAVMDIFEKISKKLRTSRVNNFKSWIYIVTRNHCFEILRQKKSQSAKENDLSLMYTDPVFHPDTISQDEDIERLQDCMSKLEGLQRSCIELFYFGKLTYADIASNLSIRYDQVRSRIQNGRRNLKLCMEQKTQGRHNK